MGSSPFEAQQENAALQHQFWESRLQSEQHLQYAESTRVRTRQKAEAALNFQKDAFENAAQQYETLARDICQGAVAQSRAELEADVVSLINAQNAEQIGRAHV